MSAPVTPPDPAAAAEPLEPVEPTMPRVPRHSTESMDLRELEAIVNNKDGFFLIERWDKQKTEEYCSAAFSFCFT